MKLVCYENLDYSKKSFALFDKFEDACLAAYVAYRNNPNMAFFTGHYIVNVCDLDSIMRIDPTFDESGIEKHSSYLVRCSCITYQVKDLLAKGKELASEEKLDI